MNPSNHFHEANRASEVLSKIGKGAADADFARAIHQAIDRSQETMKKSKVTVTVEIDPDEDRGCLRLRAEVSAKLPKLPAPASQMHVGAGGAYRYTLHRGIPSVLRWVKPCLFVMLNPSTADATKDDPTIRRCVGFAKREGCTDMTVVNLFALRATNPAELDKHADPFGPDNAKHLAEQISAHQQIGIIVAAWGASPTALGYESIDVLKMALRNAGALCLGMTKDGHPRHPLYVKADQPLIPWTGKAAA